MTKVVLPSNYEHLERAHELVHERLLRVSSALEMREISYLVIGGKAVQYWLLKERRDGVRGTPHVDLLINRQDLECTVTGLACLGFKHYPVGNAHRFADLDHPNHQPAVQLFFAGEKYKDADQFTHPELRNGVWAEEEYHVVSLYDLVLMKLNAYRRIDKVHLNDLITAGVIGRDLCGRVVPALADRLRYLLDHPEPNL